MIRRITISIANPVANPVSSEQIENSRTMTASSALLDPFLSAITLPNNPTIAQVNANTDMESPSLSIVHSQIRQNINR